MRAGGSWEPFVLSLRFCFEPRNALRGQGLSSLQTFLGRGHTWLDLHLMRRSWWLGGEISREEKEWRKGIQLDGYP